VTPAIVVREKEFLANVQKRGSVVAVYYIIGGHKDGHQFLTSPSTNEFYRRIRPPWSDKPITPDHRKTMAKKKNTRRLEKE
jgi:hypothetical protein